MTDQIYSEVLKVWNDETPDDFAIFSELYYQMFGGEFEVPYTTQSTTSAFFPYDWIMPFAIYVTEQITNSYEFDTKEEAEQGMVWAITMRE